MCKEYIIFDFLYLEFALFIFRVMSSFYSFFFFIIVLEVLVLCHFSFSFSAYYFLQNSNIFHSFLVVIENACKMFFSSLVIIWLIFFPLFFPEKNSLFDML